MSRRYALRGSGETILRLATSTICNAGLVRLPYADMLAPSQSSPTPAAAPGKGPWDEWLRIITSICPCRRSDGDGSSNHTAITVADSASANGCCCCAAFAIETLVDQATAQSTATPRDQRTPLTGRGGDSTPAAEELLHRAIHRLSDSDWADWLRVPLISAASQGDLDTVRLLLKAGVGGSGSRGIGAWMIPGGDGRTLLHAAADSGSAGVIEALLDAGAGVVVNSVTGRRGGRQGSRGFSPFHVAVIKGSVPAAMVLAGAGAAVHRRAPFQQSALHLAAGTGNAKMVHALVADLRLAVEGKDDLGGTALHAAAWHGQAECVRALLALGSQVDPRDDCGRSPLFQACRCGGGGGDGDDAGAGAGAGGSPDGYRTICELIGAGADVNAKSEDGDTPLHVACRYGHAQTVRLLLRHDADETTLCDLGKTPGDVASREALRAARRRNRCAAASADGGGNGGGGGTGRGSSGDDDFPVEVAEAIHAALAAAPAGRAWRRRGWLVLLRSRLIECDKRRLAEAAEELASADLVEAEARRGSAAATVDLAVGMLVHDANGVMSLPQTWVAMDLEEERDFFDPLEGRLERSPGNVVDFGMELEEALCADTARAGGKQLRVSADCVRGLKRLCSRGHVLFDDALAGNIPVGLAPSASDGLELRALDVSADNFVDLSLDSSPSTPDKTGAAGGSSRTVGWGFQWQDTSAAAESATLDANDWPPCAVAIGGTSSAGENGSSNSSRVDLFYEGVLRALEMADGPFEIIVSYV